MKTHMHSGFLAAILVWQSALAAPSGTLYPSHRQVQLVEVTNGAAPQFNAVTTAELASPCPDSTGSTLRLVEIDPQGEAVARLPLEITKENGRDRMWFPLPGLTPAKGHRRFLLYADAPGDVARADDHAAPPESPFDALRIESNREDVIVANEFFQAIQSAKGRGGFIRSITFNQTGTTTTQYFFEDRLYRHTPPNLTPAYGLSSDPNASSRIVCPGRLRAVIESRAVYFRGNEPLKGNARAVYRYEFLAGSPVITISAEVTQDVEESWSELHFLQLSTKEATFPIWRAGDSLAGRFTGTKQVRTVPRWGIMSDGENAVGLIGRDSLLHYDDTKEYCNYFQFPVPQWRTKQHHFEGWVYIGPLQPHSVMEQWHGRLTQPPKASVRRLEALESLRTRIATSAAGKTGSDDTEYHRGLLRHLISADPTTVTQDDIVRVDTMARRFVDRQEGDGRWSKGARTSTEPSVLIHQNQNDLWLRNAIATYHFDLNRGGRITQILESANGRDFVGASPNDKGPLWRATIRRKDGKTVTVDSVVAGRPKASPLELEAWPDRTRSRGSAAVVLEWPAIAPPECQGTVSVRALFLIEPFRGPISGRLVIQNRLSDAGLWSVEFPVIAPVCRTGRTDVAVPRLNWGKLYEHFAGEQNGEYPSGWWPMQYLSITDGPSTLYLGAHDPKCGAKRFHLRAGGEFRFLFDPPDMGKPGVDFVMDHDVVFGPMAGDWFDAARAYRSWALSQTWMSRGPLEQRNDIPRKLRDGLVWLLLSGEPKQVVPTAIAAQEYLGVPVGIHWYCWHKIPFDVQYPNYFPTKDGFKEAVKTLTDRGIYVMPYINGRLWDSGLPEFKSVALPSSAKNVDGKPLIEEYGSGAKLAVMCPTTPVWQDKLCEIIDRLVNEQGVNAVYLDQIASAGPRQCMDPTHGHPLGGGTWWVSSYWKLMDRIQQIGAARSPDVFFTSENNAESYSQNIDAFLIWNPRRPNMIPINAVVYAGMRVHFANRVHPADSDMAFAMKVGRDWLWGTQLGWMEPFYMAPEHRLKGEFFRRLGKARMAYAKFLGYGQMLRPPQVDCADEVTADWYGEGAIEHRVTWPAIGAASWRSPDRHVGLIFVNYDTVPHGFRFRLPTELTQISGATPLWCRSLDGKLVRLAEPVSKEGWVSVMSIPAREVMVIELVPCPSAADRDRAASSLPVEVPQSAPPCTGPSLRATLRLPPTPTPAGQAIPAHLRLEGILPDEPGWSIRFRLPDGYGIEPAPSVRPSCLDVKRRQIDIVIHSPENASELSPLLKVDLNRRLVTDPLWLSPKPR